MSRSTQMSTARRGTALKGRKSVTCADGTRPADPACRPNGERGKSCTTMGRPLRRPRRSWDKNLMPDQAMSTACKQIQRYGCGSKMGTPSGLPC